MPALRTIPIARARRIALAAQGFALPRPKSTVTERHFRRAMDQMTILQLDSVNVLCRSHFLPMLARLGPYDRDRLDAWLWQSRENFEYLGHEASITRLDLHPILRHRMTQPRWKAAARLREEEPNYIASVREEIKARGPLSVSDLTDPGGRTGPWWGLSKGKIALEALYIAGELSVDHRTKTFRTVYDLPERVVGHKTLRRKQPNDDRARKDLLLLGARSHGIGTAADLADYFRIRMPIARPLLAELVRDGELEAVNVPGWKDSAFYHPDAQAPRSVRTTALLSPFDPLVWFRPRAERLFDFRYRIEIYVPEAKRQYGYYVLPFLLNEALVARIDLKADRKAATLRVKAAFLEASAADRKETVARALANDLIELASWLNLSEIAIGPRGNLARTLRKTI